MAEWDLITERPPHAVYTKNRTAARPRKRAQGIPEKGVFMGILSHLFCIDINRGVRNYRGHAGRGVAGRPLPGIVRAQANPGKPKPSPGGALPGQKRFCPDLSVPLFVYAYGGETSARPSPG